MKRFLIAIMMLLAGVASASAATKTMTVDPFEMKMPSYCQAEDLDKSSVLISCANTKAKGYKKDTYSGVWMITATGEKRDNLTQERQADVGNDPKLAQSSIASMKKRLLQEVKDIESKVVGTPKIKMAMLGDVVATVGEANLGNNEHMIKASVWYDGEAYEITVVTGTGKNDLAEAKKALSTLCFCGDSQ